MKLTSDDVHPTDLIIDMPAPDSAEVVSAKPGLAWTETASLYGLIATLMWAPLAFGATEPWSQFILRTSALALFGLWIVRERALDSVQIFPSRSAGQFLHSSDSCSSNSSAEARLIATRL